MMDLTPEEIELVLAALAFYGDYLSDDQDLYPEYQKVNNLEIKIERGL